MVIMTLTGPKKKKTKKKQGNKPKKQVPERLGMCMTQVTYDRPFERYYIYALQARVSWPDAQA
jgi:hypothetical protein